MSPYKKGSIMSRVQSKAEEMMAQHGFVGVPLESFERGGRSHLATAGIRRYGTPFRPKLAGGTVVCRRLASVPGSPGVPGASCPAFFRALQNCPHYSMFVWTIP